MSSWRFMRECEGDLVKRLKFYSTLLTTEANTVTNIQKLRYADAAKLMTEAAEALEDASDDE